MAVNVYVNNLFICMNNPTMHIFYFLSFIRVYINLYLSSSFIIAWYSTTKRKKKKKKIKLGMYHLLKALSLFYRELLHYLVFELSHWGELPTVAPKCGFPLPVAWFQVHGHKLPNASFLLWPVHLISQKRKINTIFQFIGYDQCHGKVIRNRDYCFIAVMNTWLWYLLCFFFSFFFF